MQSATLILLVIVLLIVIGALRRRKPSGGNAVNTDPEIESHYSLLGDNSGRMKK